MTFASDLMPEEIKLRIVQWTAEYSGGLDGFGKYCGVSRPRIQAYIDGKNCPPDKLLRIQRALAGNPMPPKPKRMKKKKATPPPADETTLPFALGTGTIAADGKSPLQPVQANTAARQPVIGIAQAAGWSPALQPLGDFLSEFGDSVPWEEVEPGCWLLRVEGASMQPLLSHGAVLHVDTRRYPRKTELVVAKIQSEEYPVVKYYDRASNVVYLERLNQDDPDQRSYEIDIKRRDDYIHWMYPVTDIRTKAPTWQGRK